MRIAELGEYHLHNWLRRELPYAEEVGIGDDAARLSFQNSEFDVDLLVSTDFVRLDDRPSHSGKLVVIQNFSDIICKGGRPIGLLLGVQLERDASLSFFRQLVGRARAVAEAYGGRLIGGDTKEGRERCLYGVALGIADRGSVIGRVGCRPGDIVAITLTNNWRLGARWAHVAASSLGIDVGGKLRSALRTAYYRRWVLPVAETRVAIGTQAVTASMDITDGIGACLSIMSRQNGCGFRIHETLAKSIVDELAIAIARYLGVSEAKFIWSPGFDWENLFTVKAREFDSVRRAVQSAGGDLAPIGVVSENPQIEVELLSGAVRILRPFTAEKLTASSHLNIADRWYRHDDYDGHEED